MAEIFDIEPGGLSCKIHRNRSEKDFSPKWQIKSNSPASLAIS